MLSFERVDIVMMSLIAIEHLQKQIMGLSFYSCLDIHPITVKFCNSDSYCGY